MEDNFTEFLKILEELEKERVEYFIIGGFALVLFGIPRFTEDVDIVIKNNEENVLKIRNILKKLYRDDSIEEITTEELDKYAVIRYGTPSGIYIDIMTKLGDNILYDNLEYQTLDIEGQIVKVATLNSIYETKKNSLREKDKLDLLYILHRLKGKKDAGI